MGATALVAKPIHIGRIVARRDLRLVEGSEDKTELNKIQRHYPPLALSAFSSLPVDA